MLERILQCLKASQADAWEVIERNREGWEFYFIRHALDQNRYVKTKEYDVHVYRKLEDGTCIGDASSILSPDLSEEEIEKEIAQLLERATYVKNPYYELHAPTEVEEEKEEVIDLKQISEDYMHLFQEVIESAEADINSYEIFVNAMKRRYVNSNGIDVTVSYPSSMTEVIVNARDAKHEIELYRNYVSGTCNKEAIHEDITKTLQMAKDKVIATNTPKMEPIPVLFTGQDALTIYRYFIVQLNTAYIYQKISQAKKGEHLVEGCEGDPLTIRVCKHLPNSSMNLNYDSEGGKVRDLTLVNENVIENFIGSRRYSYYLKEDTFIGSNFKVEAGKHTEEELRDNRYIEIVEFSSFQVNPFNGDVFGEIRLGYLHENGEVKIVSGGSISGTMRELAKTLRFSNDLKQYNNYVIPAITRLENVTVTGIE